MSDNNEKRSPVKTERPKKNEVAANAENYRKPVKEWEETKHINGKEKIIQFRKYKNGVVKSSLKAMYKSVNGRRTQIC